MSSFTSTNARYYLLLGLLHDGCAYSLDRSLERDMVAVVTEVDPDLSWSTRGDVYHLAGFVINIFEKAGIAYDAEIVFEQVEKQQVVRDVFALHKAVKEFLNVTWTTEKHQQQEIDTLVAALQKAAAHSRGVLARRKYATA